MPERPVVVVGYDGSAASCAAVARAVERVGTSGHLYVIYAYKRPGDHVGYPRYRELVAETTRRAIEHVNGVDTVVCGMDRSGGTGRRARARRRA